jgi:hypothetical protein
MKYQSEAIRKHPCILLFIEEAALAAVCKNNLRNSEELLLRLVIKQTRFRRRTP